LRRASGGGRWRLTAKFGLLAMSAALGYAGPVTSRLGSDVGPIILWGVEPDYAMPSAPGPTDDQLAAAIRAGVSWIQTYGGLKIENREDSVGAFLDRLLRFRLQVIASVEHMSGGRLDAAFIARKILKWRSHPAVGAWELADEPEMKGIGPEDLRRAYVLCKKLDPARPVVVLWAPVEHRVSYESAGRVFDWGAIDVYPLNPSGYDATLIPQAVRELVGRMPFEERPLTPVLQAFADPRHPLPDIVTLRQMAQQFRQAGATAGLALYNWNADQAKGNLGTTGLWQALVRVPLSVEIGRDQP
jgi:hypothetical protein